jgi:hypothetical protein
MKRATYEDVLNAPESKVAEILDRSRSSSTSTASRPSSYRSRMNPSRGRNFEALDPLEWRPA